MYVYMVLLSIYTYTYIYNHIYKCAFSVHMCFLSIIICKILKGKKWFICWLSFPTDCTYPSRSSHYPISTVRCFQVLTAVMLFPPNWWGLCTKSQSQVHDRSPARRLARGLRVREYLQSAEQILCILCSSTGPGGQQTGPEKSQCFPGHSTQCLEQTMDLHKGHRPTELKGRKLSLE